MHLRSFAALAILAPLASLALGGCGSQNDSSPEVEEIHVPGPCDPTQCLPDNVCAGTPAVCMLRCNLHSDCPDGYACRPQPTGDADGGTVQVCTAAAQPVATGNGGYLTACSANLEGDCAQGFVCNGAKNQLDAFCTQLGGCQADADCPPSQWCGELHKRACTSITADRTCTSDASCSSYGAGYACFDLIKSGSTVIYRGFCEKTCAADADCGADERCGPIAGNASHKRCWKDQPNDWCDKQPDSCGKGWSCRDKAGSGGLYDPARACVNRSYCAPCANDADCGSLSSSCIEASDGSRFCADQCTPASPATCPPEAECKQVGADFHCVPRAGTCVAGAPTSCGPCRQDSDCGPDGVCDVNPSSGERSCALPCDASKKCPASPTGQPLTCCTDATRCGSEYLRCIATPHYDVPDPRYTSGCWEKGCTADADCDGNAGEVCYPRAQICFPAKKCSSSDDCSIYSGEYCEPKTGLCRPAPCQSDADCPPCSLLSGCQPGDQEQFAVCDAKYHACLPPQ